jgi:hypothetical protein
MRTSDVSGLGAGDRLGVTIRQSGEQIASLRSQQRLLARQMQDVAGSQSADTTKALRSGLIQAQFDAIDMRIQQLADEVQSVRARARMEALSRGSTLEWEEATGKQESSATQAASASAGPTSEAATRTAAARAFLNLTESSGSIDVEA